MGRKRKMLVGEMTPVGSLCPFPAIKPDHLDGIVAVGANRKYAVVIARFALGKPRCFAANDPFYRVTGDRVNLVALRGKFED
jgi:hypothetical protein